ncbi:flagellar basal-body MS-ring/collar protein FliF [Sinirhodobacter huangdaonensis]|uniref:Flagellar M-ring protein n=1 Tax=Paenirhodobacter huangdaonensis TaxID=2501515 RepID=A0A443LQ14_9RHOB|nr:flagellar basal-body MS-ring/collar protein FliF [Sinirhodobacter huangdaonensis]RWR51251.1 flagellar M-ring protein FliF [Sinirhodobacter huangdaonensis]
MQQLTTVWGNLDARRRIIVLGATALVFAAVLALSGLTARPDMGLLYAGLDGAKAGEVISALEQRAVAYEVRGDSIYVEAPKRDALRMTLAAEGLPATGGAGYELLDSLSGFGTTSQMFDAAYWRAKEGELARTILANPAIRAARVHIAPPAGVSFRTQSRPTASVTVTTGAGGLTPPQAKALKYLIASAVAGMTPEDVSVIDTASGLVAAGDETPATLGEDRAAMLRRNIERLLEARVGYGNAVVEVAVETVTEREAITERRIDPTSRTVISTDTAESSNKADESKTGGVSVASNLPDGQGANGGNSQRQGNETRERTNYDLSETTREIVRNPGDVKRITVAVLVDGTEGKDASGQITVVPRSEDEIAALHDLVASAVGFDAARGDVITLRSMAFQPIAETGAMATAGMLGGGAPLDLMLLIEIAALVLVVVVLALFVVRPALAPRIAMPPRSGLPAPLSAQPGAAPALIGEISGDEAPEREMELVADFGTSDLPVPISMASAFGGQTAELEDDPVARLKRLIGQRQAESVEILRGWMDKTQERV